MLRLLIVNILDREEKIMAEWLKTALIDIVELIGGGTPKTSKAEYWGGNINWLSVKDFNNENRYVYSTEKTITEEGLNNSSTKLLKKDDIIISARGTVGELAMITFPMAFNQSCYGIRAKEGIDSIFLYYLIKNSVRKLKAITHGSVFDTITRDTEDGEVEKEPYGVIYYTDKYYSSQSTDIEIQIVSALASYDLEKENTLSDVLERLYHDRIIDEGTKNNWLVNYGEFVKIIQNNYMVMPTYTNERLRKQSGVFLLTSLFSFNKENELKNSVISKAKGKLKEEFSDTCFYISGEDKENILKELDLYNINEATLFPELEHQLSYIKYANRNLVNPVTDFTKYEEESASSKQDIGVKQPELEQYILDNFDDQFKGIIGEEDVKEVLNIIKEHFTVDWYKRNPILSKIIMSITGYYFKKYESRDVAKQKAEQIVTLLSQMVEDFITAMERGE